MHRNIRPQRCRTPRGLGRPELFLAAAAAAFFFLPFLSASAATVDRAGIQVIDRGCGAALGAPQFVSSTNQWSEWAADENEPHFDCARVFISGIPFRPGRAIALRKDFRLCAQIKGVKGKTKGESREACSPWASDIQRADAFGAGSSLGGGWSGWAEYTDETRSRSVRIKIETRPLRTAPRVIKDIRAGIQLGDNGCLDFGAPRFTPWLREGGGWTPWVFDSNAVDPECIRVALESVVETESSEAQVGQAGVPAQTEPAPVAAPPQQKEPEPQPFLQRILQFFGVAEPSTTPDQQSSPQTSQPPPQPQTQQIQSIVGKHDGATGIVPFEQCAAFGWATNLENQNQFAVVRIYADGELITQTLADQFRPEQEESGTCPRGRCGFSAEIHNAISQDIPHTIRVRAVDFRTGQEVNLADTPQEITCVPPPPSTSAADIALTNLSLCGGGVSPQNAGACAPRAFGEQPPGACALPKRPTLSWQYSHARNYPQSAYAIQVDDADDFSSPEVDTGKVRESGSASYIVSPVLEWNTAYYWRVRVWDSEDVFSDWVKGPRFTTQPHEAPRIAYTWKEQENGKTQFSDTTKTAEDARIRSWQWAFQDGDPASASIQHPAVRFDSPGAKTTSLVVEDTDALSCGLRQSVGAARASPPQFREMFPQP